MPDGCDAWLSRESLRRVLGSLLSWELAAARGQGPRPWMPVGGDVWRDDLRLCGDGAGEPGCDSLELLRLGAAVNEVFHLHEAGAEADLLHRHRLGDWLDAVEVAWRAGVDRVTFLTSGSTAIPRRCTHPLRHLATETAFLAERFGDRRRIVALAPAHHIYGFLFTAMLAEHLGVEVWGADCAGASELALGLREHDLVVSFPERWAWIERSLPVVPAGVVGVVSTAPCPPSLSQALVNKGLAELVEVYGSSETAGIALRTDPARPYRLMPQWTLEPADTDTAPMLRHASGWRTAMPDRITLTGRDTFILRGRVDGAVQIGGINVYPAAIADRLRACPGVEQVAVRLMRADEGTRLKAFVVPVPGFDHGELEAALTMWMARHLASAERPRSLAFGSYLPVSGLGKAADW